MKKSKKIRKTDPLNPDPVIIEEAAELIRTGRIICFPTKCLYGLGADALNQEAVDQIFKIKQRDLKKPILILINNVKDVEKFAQHIPLAALKIMDKFWPGNVTIIFKAKDNLPKNLLGGTGKIGIRFCANKITSSVIEKAGVPITGTSANISDQKGCSDPSQLPHGLIKQIDLIIDTGRLENGAGSTIIDATEEPVKVIREGLAAAKDIFAALKISPLFPFPIAARK